MPLEIVQWHLYCFRRFLLSNFFSQIHRCQMAEIMKKRLRESIKMLSEKETAIIEAYYFDGLTERQIAKDRDVSQTTIHRYRKKAIEKLKKLLKG